MMLNDEAIENLVISQHLLNPFSQGTQGGGVISYGLSHAGYDLRLGDSGILVFKNSYNRIINPKLFKDEEYRKMVFDKVMPADKDCGEVVKGSYVIPPHGYALGYSLEHISMPKYLKGRCVGKSTLARSGILINTTPLEPGWKGHLTIEISNITPCPALVFANEGIAQLEFEMLTAPCKIDYGKKDGKYQDQGPEAIPSRTKE